MIKHCSTNKRKLCLIITGVFLILTLFLMSQYLTVVEFKMTLQKVFPVQKEFWIIKENTSVLIHNGSGIQNVSQSEIEMWPSIRETNITVQEIQSKYTSHIAESIKTNNECSQVYMNSSQVWRSSSVAGDTSVADLNRMTLASSCGALFYDELMKPSPCIHVFPWEQYYLSTPMVNSVDDLARASNSHIKLITSPWNNNSFVLGSEVKFLIELFNGREERRTLGGDLINVWLVSDDPKTAIAADVTDHHNGTYTAVTVLPWSGNVKVMAGIAQEREKFRMMFYLQRIFKTTHWFVANFVSVNISEVTPCLPFPSLPGYSSSDVCNYTEQNGSPWYCGKPDKKEFLNVKKIVL